MKFATNPSTKWKKFERKIAVNFRLHSDFDRFNKPLHPLDTKKSIEKHKKIENTYHQKPIANGYSSDFEAN